MSLENTTSFERWYSLRIQVSINKQRLPEPIVVTDWAEMNIRPLGQKLYWGPKESQSDDPKTEKYKRITPNVHVEDRP